MSSTAALSIFKPILIVGALAALGMGGYNLATTGSPLGSCNKAGQNTGILAASDADAPKSSCDMGSYDTEATQAQLTDFGTEMAKDAGCCGDKKEAVKAMGECPEGMMAQMEETSECSMGAAQVSLPADHCEDMEATECEENMDPAECEMDGKGAADPGLTADAEQIETETSEG